MWRFVVTRGASSAYRAPHKRRLILMQRKAAVMCVQRKAAVIRAVWGGS